MNENGTESCHTFIRIFDNTCREIQRLRLGTNLSKQAIDTIRTNKFFHALSGSLL